MVVLLPGRLHLGLFVVVSHDLSLSLTSKPGRLPFSTRTLPPLAYLILYLNKYHLSTLLILFSVTVDNHVLKLSSS